jgi:hypothetical protein
MAVFVHRSAFFSLRSFSATVISSSRRGNWLSSEAGFALIVVSNRQLLQTVATA